MFLLATGALRRREYSPRRAVGCAHHWAWNGLLLVVLLGLAGCMDASRESVAAGWRGYRLEREGNYQEAIAAYRTSLALLGPVEQVDVGILVAISRCLMALERWQECEEWLCDAIRARPCEDLWLEYALLIARSKLDDVILYVDALGIEGWRKSRFMTRFHRMRGDECAASVFADDWLAEVRSSSATDEHDIIEAAEEIAPCYLDAGLIGAAYDLARLGVELSGEILRRLNRPYAQCIAGSFPCRIVLAEISLMRGLSADAAAEFAHARVLARTARDHSVLRELSSRLR
jgi:hypothetical protein